jgi:hypothetical protein
MALHDTGPDITELVNEVRVDFGHVGFRFVNAKVVSEAARSQPRMDSSTELIRITR